SPRDADRPAPPPFPTRRSSDLDRAPVERRLEFASRRAPAARHDVALRDVALAPAVDRGVDGEAERAISVGDRARHVVVDPGLVADRKSTRLNSSHLGISYAVFC